MSPIFFILFILSSLYISTINSWGLIGHALVAKIAQNVLTEDSKKFVHDLLPWYTTGNLSMLASWPDTIADPNTNPVDYLNWLWTKELHYVNSPDWICKYDRNRDCDWIDKKYCIDGAIQNYTKRVVDTKQNHIQRQEALKFLIHFIGDAHQPLHAGFSSDKGGNFIRGHFFDKLANLHTLWDTLMIERRISLDFQNDENKYYDYLLKLQHTTYANNISEWIKCSSIDESYYLACTEAWINENMELNCEYIYRDEQDRPFNTSKQFDLSDIYYNTRIVIVEQRLIQGGVRLGNVINKIVEIEKHKHHGKDNNEICVETRLLVICIFVEILLTIIYLIYYLNQRKLYQQPLTNTLPKYHIVNSVKT